LFVLAFDDDCYSYLQSIKKENLIAVRLQDFENEALLKAKAERSAAEYCWTCSASSIHFFIEKYKLDHCTYIDADMYFYSDPEVLIREMGNNSVLITPHNYSPEYDNSSISGRYCVQFVCFKNTADGMAVLNWWKDSCIDWCFDRVEDGKFGDQKYLDEFSSRFSGVYECNHPGAGIAPWNLQQYEFEKEDDKLVGVHRSDNMKFVPVFFHFHGLKFYQNNIVNYAGGYYEIKAPVFEFFYEPYVQLLAEKAKNVRASGFHFDPNGGSRVSPSRPLDVRLKMYFYLSGLKQSLRNVGLSYLRQRISRHYFYYY